MSRRPRRALGRLFGGAQAQEHAAQLEALRRDNADMRAQLDELLGRVDAVPGVVEGRRDWFVLVGSEQVPIKAISPADWLTSLEELPSFLYAFSVERVTRPGGELSAELLTQIHELASKWIRATAVDPDALDLSRLTVSEAEHAIVHVSELNGVTAHMRKWFRERLDAVAGRAHGRESVRATPELPPGDLPN